VLVAPAAAADEVVVTYRDAAFDSTVAKILVVGVHDDISVRGQFENTVARALRAVGTAGEASLYTVSGVDELTADTLVAAARRANADAVMVTRVIDVQAQNPDGPTSLYEHFRSFDGYPDPLADAATHTVVVRTDLYLVATEQRLWGVESTAVEKRTLFGVIEALATATAAQLRRDGLIE
jgi:hypothetical protein